jgi:hypothetical protein
LFLFCLRQKKSGKKKSGYFFVKNKKGKKRAAKKRAATFLMKTKKGKKEWQKKERLLF